MSTRGGGVVVVVMVFHILITTSTTEGICRINITTFDFLLLFYYPGNRPLVLIYIVVSVAVKKKPSLTEMVKFVFFHLSRISPFSTERVTNINDYIL